MAHGLFALNFYSPLFADQLRRGRKTAAIRLGDKSAKYERSQIVWVTIGSRHSRREKIFSALIDEVEVKKLSELSPRDVERDNPELRRVEETCTFLERIYDRPIDMDAQVTVIHFSQIVEPGISGFGTIPSPN